MHLVLLRTEELHYLKFLTAKRMAKVQITQARSIIKRPETQKRTIKALGLGKINKAVEVELTPQIAGMIRKVNHLITVKEL
jgi:large subunit ribosomal protein L30